MARLRFILIAAFVLVMVGCPLFQQQENCISFTCDGIRYFYTASDDASGHAYAVGYYRPGYPVNMYVMSGSATSEASAAGFDTLLVTMEHVENYWEPVITLYDGDGNLFFFDPPNVSEGAIDSFITNRDAVGGQFAGAMPGPFQDRQLTHTLENVVFSVERLPDEVSIPQ
jgi:hypothetical protein